MTISEFNEQCRIGMTVYVGRAPFKIKDIDRRNHVALNQKNGWIRCSEFSFAPPEHKKKGIWQGRKVIKAVNGKIVAEYSSVAEASRDNGYSNSSHVFWQCRHSNNPDREFYFKDDPKIKHLLK